LPEILQSQQSSLLTFDALCRLDCFGKESNAVFSQKPEVNISCTYSPCHLLAFSSGKQNKTALRGTPALDEKKIRDR
jgi:hypothetical protein